MLVLHADSRIARYLEIVALVAKTKERLNVGSRLPCQGSVLASSGSGWARTGLVTRPPHSHMMAMFGFLVY